MESSGKGQRGDKNADKYSERKKKQSDRAEFEVATEELRHKGVCVDETVYRFFGVLHPKSDILIKEMRSFQGLNAPEFD